jgi:hypothetical protein
MLGGAVAAHAITCGALRTVTVLYDRSLGENIRERSRDT